MEGKLCGMENTTIINKNINSELICIQLQHFKPNEGIDIMINIM